MKRAGRLLDGVHVIGISGRTQWEEMRTAPLVYVVGIVQPTVLLLVMLTPRTEPPAALVNRVAVGVMLTAFWGSTVWGSAGILRRERFHGTLARTLVGVRDPRLVILGKSLGSSLVAVAMVTASVAVVLVALGLNPRISSPWWLLTGMVAVLLSGTAVGGLVGSLFVLTRYGPQLSSALMYPVYLLGGMLIPLDLVPAWLRWLSNGISLRWLQQFLVSAVDGSPDLLALLAALVLTAGYGLAGALLFGRLIDVARKRGTLDLY